MSIDLHHINQQLAGKSAGEIIQWALGTGKRVFASTSFSPNSGVMLNLVKKYAPEIPVIWIDSGYNVPDAYQVAEKLMQQLQLDMRIYNPLASSERRNALMGGIPHPDDKPDLFQEFVRQVKLEPFARAVAEIQGEIWLAGIRRDETEFRQGLDIVTKDPRGLLRVAPIFNWTQDDVTNYMSQHQLPTCKHYFDPTKLDEKSECGLHTGG
jgi:phosphoadenosine phosphosulfate reductase